MGLINIIGQVLSLAGFVILFRFGMPFHVPNDGKSCLLLEGEDENDKIKERSYKLYGYIGFALAIIGTIMQIYVSYKTITPFW